MIFDHLILDFDGILNGTREGPFHFQEVREGIKFQIETKNFEVFQQLLTLIQPRKISICSNWRYYFTADELQEMLSTKIPVFSTQKVFNAENFIMDKILLIGALVKDDEVALVIEDLDIKKALPKKCYFLYVEGGDGLNATDLHLRIRRSAI